MTDLAEMLQKILKSQETLAAMAVEITDFMGLSLSERHEVLDILKDYSEEGIDDPELLAYDLVAMFDFDDEAFDDDEEDF